MKKSIIIICMLACFPAAALAQADQPSASGLKAKEQNQTKNQGEETMVQTRENVDTGESPGSAEQKSQAKQDGGDRRSRVAQAVQEMLGLAERSGGIGEQVRVIARSQNQAHNEIEGNLEQIRTRSRIKKFFIGPDYEKIELAKQALNTKQEEINQLKQLALSLADSGLQEDYSKQIEELEDIQSETLLELVKERQGFSLFGWLVRWLNK